MYTGLKSIFPSRARAGLLAFFLLNPKDRYYLREICRATGLPLQSVQRELKNLESLGLLEKVRESNRVFYGVRTDFFLYPELKSIILKTVGLGDIIRSNLLDQKDIEIAFVYGSYAQNTQNTQSDIDLLVVGEITSRKLHALVRQAQKGTKREINFINYSSPEFRHKIKTGDHFVTSVLKGPKIFIVGDDNALQKIN